MAEQKGRANIDGMEAMENGAPPNPKVLTDEKGFARSDLEKYDDDGHVAREGLCIPIAFIQIQSAENLTEYFVCVGNLHLLHLVNAQAQQS